jgi:anti-sigma factor RsiW
MEKHVAACDGCKAYMESITVTVRAIGELPPEPADEHVKQHLMAAFRDLRGA